MHGCYVTSSHWIQKSVSIRKELMQIDSKQYRPRHLSSESLPVTVVNDRLTTMPLPQHVVTIFPKQDLERRMKESIEGFDSRTRICFCQTPYQDESMMVTECRLTICLQSSLPKAKSTVADILDNPRSIILEHAMSGHFLEVLTTFTK